MYLFDYIKAIDYIYVVSTFLIQDTEIICLVMFSQLSEASQVEVLNEFNYRDTGMSLWVHQDVIKFLEFYFGVRLNKQSTICYILLQDKVITSRFLISQISSYNEIHNIKSFIQIVKAIDCVIDYRKKTFFLVFATTSSLFIGLQIWLLF